LVDARLSWNETAYSLYAEVNNVLNKRNYVDYGNVPQPGTWVVVGYRFRFTEK
jgi:iron complex outermembrane receptor protein